MKTALVITYDFPPCSAPGAATRTLKLTKYLRSFGWESVVVCRRETGFDSPSASDNAIEVIRIPTPVSPRISYQLGAWAWAARIAGRLRDIVTAWRPDLVYLSCPPFTYGVAAMRVAREIGVPFVLDFRDAWSLDPHMSGGTVKKALKRIMNGAIYSRLERHLLRAAAAAVMNTPSMQREYGRVYGAYRNKLHLIPNGFDDDDFRETVERPRRERPLLVYCGRLSGLGDRSPETVLRVIRAAVDAGLPVDFAVVGDESAELRGSIGQLNLEPFIKLRGVLSHQDAIREMRRADVLILYQSSGRTGVSSIAGKTFEYLRSGRPILALLPPGDNADLVQRYAQACAVVGPTDTVTAAAAVRELVAKSKREPAPLDPEFLQDYDRRRIAQKMAAVFDRAIEGPMRISGGTLNQGRSFEAPLSYTRPPSND